MKKQFLFFFIFCLLVLNIGKAQSNKKYLYYLDVNLQSTDKSKAAIYGEGKYENELFRIDCFGMKNKKLLLSFHCTDSSLSDIKGLYTSYHLNGKQEAEGDYQNGMREGVWLKWDSLGRKTDSIIYKADKEFIKATYFYRKNGKVLFYLFSNNFEHSYHDIFYNDSALIHSEIYIKGENSYRKKYTNVGVEIDSLFSNLNKQSEFPDSTAGWLHFLQKNLNAEIPSENGAAPGKYTATVVFTVTIDGIVDDIMVETNNGFGVEEEVIRVMNKSPKWIPGVKNGQIVNSRKKQNITFQVVE